MMNAGLGQGAPASVFEVQDQVNHSRVLRIEERSSSEGGELLQERLYKSVSDQLAGSEAVRLGAGDPLQLRSYLFEDLGTGERTELKVDGGKANVQYRAAKDAAVKTKDVAWGPRTLTGNLLPALITKHWPALVAGEDVDFELFVPFRLETVGFRLKREAEAEGSKTVVIHAEASNWLIRQFAPAISFVYSTEGTPRLMKYRGPAPVQIDGEKTKAVEIDFHAAPLAAG